MAQKESQKLFTHPVRRVKKQSTPQRSVLIEPMQPTHRLPGTGERKDRTKSN